MTDHSEHEFGEAEDDARGQLLDSLADGLASLSEASDTPDGVPPVSSTFSSSDIDFATDAWMTKCCGS